MRNLVALVIVASLVACSTTQPVAPQPQPTPVAPTATLAHANPQTTLSNVPEWFTVIPKKDDYIYAVGDGLSSSVSGAMGNARANAFEGICQGAGGTVRSQTKIFRQDTESNSTSMSTTAIRNLCADVSVAGAQVTQSQVVVENNRYHAFVMVALPLGEKNAITRKKQADLADINVKSKAEHEFHELDKLNDQEQTKSSQPVSKVESINLLPVDNEEYKRRRDETLQKPGAVIGQMTLQAQ